MVEVNAWYYARGCHHPGQQYVTPDWWEAYPVTVNHHNKRLNPVQRAYRLRFAKSPGWYFVTFCASCPRHRSSNTSDVSQAQPTKCRACQTAQQCLSCSTIVQVEPPAPTVSCLIITDPELIHFTTPASEMESLLCL